MKSGVIFIAGVYGTGKTTVAKELSKRLAVPCFQASELIADYNGEHYGATKHVKDVRHNQAILNEAVANLRTKHKTLILTGHFAIFSGEHAVEVVPQEIFWQLGIAAIVLLETTVERVKRHIRERDGREYAETEISALAEAEHRLAEQAAEQNGIPLYIWQMNFSTDCAEIAKIIQSEECK